MNCYIVYTLKNQQRRFYPISCYRFPAAAPGSCMSKHDPLDQPTSLCVSSWRGQLPLLLLQRDSCSYFWDPWLRTRIFLLVFLFVALCQPLSEKKVSCIYRAYIGSTSNIGHSKAMSALRLELNLFSTANALPALEAGKSRGMGFCKYNFACMVLYKGHGPTDDEAPT